jgi:hypothetical protein
VLSLFQLALPSVILLYFLIMAARARVYLLGLPFLMFMASSIFFDRIRIFWMPARLDTADLMMLWMVIVWLVCSDVLLPRRHAAPDLSRRDGPAAAVCGGHRPRFSADEVVLLLLAGLVVLNVALTAIGNESLLATLGAARGVFYLFAGYLIVRSIVSRAETADVLGLLRALVVVNTVAAVLFIVHQGLQVQIYSATEYLTFTFMGQRLTRSFYFMPQLLGLAVAYAFAARRWSWWLWAVALISFVAVWITYTRSLLVIAFVEAAIVIVLRLFRREPAGRVLKRAAAMLATAVVVFAVVVVVFPVQTEYFFSRITSAGTDVSQEQNLVSRWDDVRLTYRWSSADDAVLGSKFVTERRDPRVRVVDDMASDTVWVPLLFRLGIAGAVLVVLLYLAEGARAVRLALREEEPLSTLGIVMVAVLAGSFLEGFVSWTFMQPSRMPMGLWAFGLVAGLASHAAPLSAEERRRQRLSVALCADGSQTSFEGGGQGTPSRPGAGA